MSTEIKFIQEELDQIKQLRDNTNRIIYQFGEIDLELHLMHQRTNELQNLRTELQTEYQTQSNNERTLVDELNKKYGAGQVDIESGIFIPNS
jgi:ribosomal protein S24E